MAEEKLTVFQRLQRVLSNGETQKNFHTNNYNIVSTNSDVIATANSKDEYERKVLQAQQQALLGKQWIKANYDIASQTLAGLNDLKRCYTEYDLMDQFPEIGAALDIFSEEACLHGDTKIKLLNGEVKTIKELYNENYKDFWVYSVDENGNSKPSCIEKVIYKGKKPIYKVILDDGTEILCTDNHKWLLSNNVWIETRDLKSGDSLLSIYSIKDNKGYEKIKSTFDKNFRLTHRIVAENILTDEKQKLIDNNFPHQKIVIHHKSFNKLNNDPNYLMYMYWNDHQKLHTDLNRERWDDVVFSQKMRNIFSETAKKTWQKQSEELKKKFKESWIERKESLSKEDFKKIFGRNGEQNGMFGVHRYGELNPNYDKNKNHFNDINIDEYVTYLINNSLSIDNVCSHFNINKKTFYKINKYITKHYGIKRITNLKYALKNKEFLELLDELKKCGKKPTLDILSTYLGESKYIVRKFLKQNNIDLLKIQRMSDYNIDEICEYLNKISTLDYVGLISHKYNFSKKKTLRILQEICQKYNISNIKNFKYSYKNGEKLSTIKNLLINNPNVDKHEVSKTIGMSSHELLVFVKKQGYKNYNDFKKSLYNHRVVSIAPLNITDDVFDLLNSTTNHCFGVQCNNGLIISHNCWINDTGVMVNVSSRSDRVKSILEDLFVNRLSIHTILPMICRSMCKYGNTFMLLNIDSKNGILGWKQLPVYEMERWESGQNTPYATPIMNLNTVDENAPQDTKFVWVGQNEYIPYRNWQIAHFRLLYDSIFLPYGCLVGDTRIETEFGYKEMSNIEIGDKVWTFNVDTQKRELGTVTIFMPKGEKDVYKVSTFHNEIEATDDHKLLTYDEGELKYKEVKDLKIGDLLIIDNSFNKCDKKIKIDKSYPTEKEANLNKNMTWWGKNIDFIPDYIDEDFAKFFGFMIGDGWITGNKCINFATGEYENFNIEFAKYVEKITNNKCRFIKANNSKNSKYDYTYCINNSKCLSIIMYRMGFIDGFDKKRIPNWVFNSNDNIKKAFLNGLMIADGSYNIDKYGVLRCAIEMSNEQLIKDIKILVQSLGYKSSRVSNRNRINKHCYSKNGNVITIRNTSYYFYFYETFNKQEKKYDLLNRLENGFKTEKIRKIDYVGKKQTYDFTVDNGNSNFFANGIVTHNCSALFKARRHFRMLSQMEDMMLIYRLDRSIERRVFKINVGAIDENDVQAYVQEIANNFKRKPIVDPLTGQIDLRKSFMNVTEDFFIPTRDDNAANPIETLQGAQNLTAMDDIKFVQNKVLTALRVPRSFLNFEETTGDGKNLSLLDVRFTRTVNRIQQALLMELNKIAIIHLYINGFQDELNNFTLTMNNPSSQAEMLELENLAKKITTAKDAVSDPGGGMPLTSLMWAWKHIFKWSDKEIKQNLEELRLETALTAELQKTMQIIKKTGLFDKVDNIYGEPGAEYSEQPQGEGDDMGGMGGGPGGGGGMPPIGGGDMDFGDEGDMGEDMGAEGEMGMDMAAQENGIGGPDNGGGPDMGGPEPNGGSPAPNLAESFMRRMNKKLINEKKRIKNNLLERSKHYSDILEQRLLNSDKENKTKKVDIYDKAFFLNEEMNNIKNQLEKINDDFSENEE